MAKYHPESLENQPSSHAGPSRYPYPGGRTIVQVASVTTTVSTAAMPRNTASTARIGGRPAATAAGARTVGLGEPTSPPRTPVPPDATKGTKALAYSVGVLRPATVQRVRPPIRRC